MVYAQTFYSSMSTALMYMAGPGDDLQMFHLNPATPPTTNNRVGGYLLRHTHQTTFIAKDDSSTETKSDLLENGYGAGALFDLGAGTAAGITAEKFFAQNNVTVSTSNSKPVEHMDIQTFTGRINIELATGLRVGVALRFLGETGAILGSPNASVKSDVIRYSGNLIGHGAGLYYGINQFTVGGVYFPAARGKSEILSEERIIDEPGDVLVDGSAKFDVGTIGLGIERSVHKRDERAAQVLSEDGRRTLDLAGIGQDKNAFLTQTIHVGGEYKINPALGIRVNLAQHTREWVFDRSRVPGDSSDPDSFSYSDIKLAAHYNNQQYDVQGAYGVSNWSTVLSGRSGTTAGSQYKGDERVIMVTAGAKF